MTQKTGTGWYPAAVHKPIPAGPNDPVIRPALAILHVAVSNALSLFGWFNGPSGGVESHFYIRKDGTVEQYRSVYREADANYKANSYLVGQVRFGAVSIETQGWASGSWTAEQLEAIKTLLLWLRKTHGIQFKPVTNYQPDRQNGGVSYHSRFVAWSNVKGKTCPGEKRIAQYNDILVPWMADIVNCLHCPVHCPKEP